MAHTDDLLDKHLHACPWFTCRLPYFIEIHHRFKMTCGMWGSLQRRKNPLVWKFVSLGKSVWKNDLLIQNTDVIVTRRENESLNKLTYILHELALSEVYKFLWFGPFLFYVLKPITQQGKKGNTNCGIVFGWPCGFRERVSLLWLYTFPVH